MAAARRANGALIFDVYEKNLALGGGKRGTLSLERSLIAGKQSLEYAMTKSTDHREGRSGTEAKNDVAETVARQTKRMANAAGEEAAALAAKQKSRVQDYLADFSSALKEGGQSLENSGHDASAYFVNQLASELEAATMEEGRSPAELLQEVEQFARRRPAVFFGAALLAGFGAMRFIKSADAARSR